MDAHGGWSATPTDCLQFGLRVDGFAAPPDLLQAGTITTMMTGSAANATYACGWGVDGSARDSTRLAARNAIGAAAHRHAT